MTWLCVCVCEREGDKDRERRGRLLALRLCMWKERRKMFWAVSTHREPYNFGLSRWTVFHCKSMIVMLHLMNKWFWECSLKSCWSQHKWLRSVSSCSFIDALFPFPLQVVIYLLCIKQTRLVSYLNVKFGWDLKWELIVLTFPSNSLVM